MRDDTRRRTLLCLVATAVATVLGPPAGAQRFSEWSDPVNAGPSVNTAFFEG